MNRPAAEIPQPTVDGGVITARNGSCRYSIFQPAVTQWVAIGVLEFAEDTTPVLLVESARNVADAIAALRRRVAIRTAQRNRQLASLVA